MPTFFTYSDDDCRIRYNGSIQRMLVESKNLAIPSTIVDNMTREKVEKFIAWTIVHGVKSAKVFHNSGELYL